MSETESILDEAKTTLSRVQAFDTERLIRKEELGKHAFTSAVEPARHLVQLLSALSVNHLAYFPDQQLNQIKDASNSIFSLFQSIEKFDVENAQPTVADAQQAIISNLESQYQSAFNIFAPLIAFATTRSQDFATLEREARSAAQAAQDQADKVLQNLNEQREAADRIIQEVRAAAAEQGVSTQAIHFKSEADIHKASANSWLKRSVYTSIALGAFAVASLFVHKLPFLIPNSPYDATQLIVSKVLIFGVIAYMLMLCARNFLSHRHNEVVNRHRQNALATFTALVEASADPSGSDIVLTHAAACIFAPQETGYAKQEASKLDTHPAFQLLPRLQQITNSS